MKDKLQEALEKLRKTNNIKPKSTHDKVVDAFKKALKDKNHSDSSRDWAKEESEWM